MTTVTTPSPLALVPSLETAWQDVDSSFERFCLTAGIGAIEQMLCEDAQQLAGTPHNRGGGRIGHMRHFNFLAKRFRERRHFLADEYREVDPGGLDRRRERGVEGG